MNPLPRSRLALGNFHYVRCSFEFFLDSAVSLGMANIELWAGAPHFLLDTLNAGVVAETKAAVEDRGLRIVCLTPEQCSYPVNIASPHGELRRRSLDTFKKAIDAAAMLGCPRVLVTAGCGDFDASRDEAWARSAASMLELSAFADGYPVALSYETLSIYSSNIVNDAVGLARMLDELDRPNIRPMLDTGQMALIGESIESYPSLFGSRLDHVHLVDATPKGHLALGDGTLPIAEYLETLEGAGYGGFYSFEITDFPYRLDPRGADAKGLAWMEGKGLLATV